MEPGPYADLVLFNATTTRLLEIVNTYLVDPFDDSDNFKPLQAMMLSLVEATEETIKRKANRVIAEMIVNNYNNPFEPPVNYVHELPSISEVTSNKRKSPDSFIDPESKERSPSTMAPVATSVEQTISGLVQAQHVTVPPLPAVKYHLPQPWIVETPSKDWTDFDIRRLRSVVSQFGESWYDVAVYMNCGLTAKQCCDKWQEIKDHPEIGRLGGNSSSSTSTDSVGAAAGGSPANGTTATTPASVTPSSSRNGLNNGSSNYSNSNGNVNNGISNARGALSAAGVVRKPPGVSLVGLPYKTPPQYREWTQYEVIYLKELVVKFKQGPKGRRFINWALVGQALNRAEQDCRDRHRHMILTKVKKGPYKPEEDARIVKLVKECLESGAEGVSNEVWEQLEKELGRPAKNVRLRWRITLSRRSVSDASNGFFTFNGSTVRIAGNPGSKSGGAADGEDEGNEEDYENVEDEEEEEEPQQEQQEDQEDEEESEGEEEEEQATGRNKRATAAVAPAKRTRSSGSSASASGGGSSATSASASASTATTTRSAAGRARRG